MSDYRLYFMSNCGRHIDRVEPIEADSDTVAAEIAKLHQERGPMELWLRDRKVEAFQAAATGKHPGRDG